MNIKEIVTDFEDVMAFILQRRPYSWIILRDKMSRERLL